MEPSLLGRAVTSSFPTCDGALRSDGRVVILRDATSAGSSTAVSNQVIGLDLAFNLHATQLAEVELTAHIKRILAIHQAPGNSVTFELTESGLLEVAVALENLVCLRMMGCRFCIDDFGAGFSSLQRMCQLSFNEIKLDAEFVRGFLHEPRCKAVVGSTLALGQMLSMSVVIEGIETAEQHQALLATGCTQGQGYWHARLMNDVGLLRWLQRSAGRP